MQSQRFNIWNTMAQEEVIRQFEASKIRVLWDSEKEKYFFSIVDVIEALTDTDRPRKYWGDLKSKLKKEGSELSEKIGQLKMQASDGKLYMTDVADTEQVLRLVQSIPSKKAEPFKLWLARVGQERLNQLQDPELGIQQALRDYKRLGYSDNWINQRLKSIEIRKDLTDQWDQHGVKEGLEYATLTDIIYQAWAGKTAREYKEFKGLKKENLRDNMTNEELVLNMLAELSTTSITRSEHPSSLQENMDVAARGGKVARVAREELEAQTGRNVVSPLSAKRFFNSQQPSLSLEEEKADKDKE